MEVPAVDAETLRTVWKIRQKLPNGAIDAVIFQQACKPGADVMAASQRATLLQLILQMAPKGAFDVFLEEGQPNDAVQTLRRDSARRTMPIVLRKIPTKTEITDQHAL